jgi:hypothetical protein
MNDWMKGTTYTPASGLRSLAKNTVDGQGGFMGTGIAGLSDRGKGVLGAFGSGMQGAGKHMLGRPQAFFAPRMDVMPEAAPAMPMESPAPMGAPQQGKGAFAAGGPKPPQYPGNGFLAYLRGR